MKYFKHLLVITIFLGLGILSTSQNLNNSVRAFDKIYFGKVNPDIKYDSDYLQYLAHYRTEISGEEFYYWPPSERYSSEYGLFKFGLATVEIYELNVAKKIGEKIKSVIDLKYSNREIINISDKENSEEMHSTVNKFLEKYNPGYDSSQDLKASYNTYENRWIKNGIIIQFGYRIEYAWVDINGRILKQDGSDMTSKNTGQKKFYRPILTFTYKNIMDKVSSEDKKSEADYKKRSLEKDASKF